MWYIIDKTEITQGQDHKVYDKSKLLGAYIQNRQCFPILSFMDSKTFASTGVFM